MADVEFWRRMMPNMESDGSECPMSWSEVLALDLIGRELELEESEGTTRGPISAVEQEGHTVRFHRRPVTVVDAGGKRSDLDGDCCVSVNMSPDAHQPIAYRDGRIRFWIMYIGTATIHPHKH